MIVKNKQCFLIDPWASMLLEVKQPLQENVAINQPDFDVYPFEPCGAPFNNAGCILFLGNTKIGGM